MPAELLLRTRLALSETAFVEIVIWRVPKPVRGSPHNFKYRLALVSEDICVLRYDNEAGKGDHKILLGLASFEFHCSLPLLDEFLDLDSTLSLQSRIRVSTLRPTALWDVAGDIFKYTCFLAGWAMIRRHISLEGKSAI